MKPVSYDIILEENICSFGLFLQKKKKSIDKKMIHGPLHVFLLLARADEFKIIGRDYNNNLHIYPVKFIKNELPVKILVYNNGFISKRKHV